MNKVTRRQEKHLELHIKFGQKEIDLFGLETLNILEGAAVLVGGIGSAHYCYESYLAYLTNGISVESIYPAIAGTFYSALVGFFVPKFIGDFKERRKISKELDQILKDHEDLNETE